MFPYHLLIVKNLLQHVIYLNAGKDEKSSIKLAPADC